MIEINDFLFYRYCGYMKKRWGFHNIIFITNIPFMSIFFLTIQRFGTSKYMLKKRNMNIEYGTITNVVALAMIMMIIDYEICQCFAMIWWWWIMMIMMKRPRWIHVIVIEMRMIFIFLFPYFFLLIWFELLNSMIIIYKDTLALSPVWLSIWQWSINSFSFSK